MQNSTTSKCKLMSPQVEQELNSKGLDNSIIEISPMKAETYGPPGAISTQLCFVMNGTTQRMNSIPVDQLQPPDIPESDGILSIDKQRETHSMIQKKMSPFAKLIINCHSLKFANKMISFIRPDCKFSQKQHEILNDKASSYTKQKGKISGNFLQQNLNTVDLQIRIKIRAWKNTIVNKLSGYLSQLYNQIPLIEPNSIQKLVWDFVLCVIRIYLIIWSPIIISFPHLEKQHSIYFLISCFFLIFDIVLRMFTIYFHKGLPVKDRQKLFKKQLTFGLIIEFGSILFGILISLQYELSTWFYALFYYQLMNILKLVNIIQYNLKPTKTVSSVIDLGKLIAMVLLIQHFCGCLWIKIGQYYLNMGKVSWMDGVKDQTWEVQFLESFYFMAVTMFTVGYGDISPTNSFEKMFCICYMFLSTLQYSYSVNTIGLILTQMKENNEMIRQKMTCINEYLHSKKLSAELSMKVREYFNFYWNQEIIQKKNEQLRLIKLLPDELQQKLKLDSAQTLIVKCPFFKQFTQTALTEILQTTDFSVFQPGVLINTQDNIYIIESGKVEVLREKIAVDLLKENQYFGLQELMSSYDNLEYRSADFTSLLIIPRESIKKVINKSQIQIQFEKHCYVCHDKRHYTQQCNVVHYVPEVEKVIMRYHFHQSQERRLRQKQRRMSRFSARNEWVLIQDSAKIYQMEHDIVPENEVQEQQSQQFSLHQNAPPKIGVVTFEDQQVQQLSPPDWFIETSFNPAKFMQRTSLLQQTQMIESFKNKREKKLLNSGATTKNDLTVVSEKPESAIHQETLAKLQSLLTKLEDEVQRDQVLFLTKKLEGMLGLTEIADFEQLKEFEKFDKEWNIDRIITKVMRPIRKNNKEILTSVINRYSKYLLFPYEFVRLFRNSLIDEEDCSNKNKSYLEQVRHSVRHFLKRKQTTVFPIK